MPTKEFTKLNEMIGDGGFVYADIPKDESNSEVTLRDRSSFTPDIFDTEVSFNIDIQHELMLKLMGVTPIPQIEKVIYNYPATIIFWSDKTKTVVKVADDEQFDPEKGLAMAIIKKMFGNTGRYYDLFKEWLPKEDKSEYRDFSKYMNPPEKEKTNE